jgi:ABC-type lipoprotein release transport system permease subunit
MGQLFLIAFRSLLQHRRRTFVLGSAIALVTALLLSLAGLYTGMRATLLEAATTLMSGHVNVAGFYKVTAGQAAPIVTDYEKIRAIVMREVPEVDYTVVRGRGWAKLVSDTGSLQAGLGGIEIDNEPGFKKVLRVRSGNVDDLRKPDAILLFEEQAKKLGVKVGDQLTVSAPTFRGTNNTLDVTVVAIAADIGMLSAWNTYMNDKGLRALYTMNENTTGAIQIYLKDLTKVKDVQERLRKVLVKEGYGVLDDNPNPFWMKFDPVSRESWTGQKLDITNWEDETAFVKWMMFLVAFISTVVIFVLLVIILVGVWMVMWISIRERTREIGTLRAVGMQRRRVLMMFLIEGFMLGAFGTVFGVAVGLGSAGLLNALHIGLPQAWQMVLLADHLFILPTVGWCLFAVVFTTVAITSISLIPSYLASRLKPVTAMSHIG